jgi:hypothetical protein
MLGDVIGPDLFVVLIGLVLACVYLASIRPRVTAVSR